MQEQSDFEKIDSLNFQAEKNRDLEPKAALDFATRALTLAEEKQYAAGLAQSLAHIAYCCYRLSDFDAAMMTAKRALLLVGKENLPDACKRVRADALNSQGLVNWNLGDYESALSQYFESLSILKEINDEFAQANTLNNIGIVYGILGDEANALNYFQQSLQLMEKIGDERSSATTLNSIGMVYNRMGDYESALNFFRQSQLLQERAGDESGLASSYNNIGDCLEQLSDEENALIYFQKALDLSEKTNNRVVEAYCLTNLGHYYAKKSRIEVALLFLHRALAIAENISVRDLISNLHQLLADVYAQTKDFEKALKHHRIFYSIQAQILGAESSTKLKQLEMRLHIERASKESEIQRIKVEELTRTNQTLREANDLKTELLAIAAHDLKNPLAAVMSFAELIESPKQMEKTAHYARIIRDLANQMLHIITELLNMQLIEAGKMQLHKRPIDLAQLTEILIYIHQQRASEKQQTIEFFAEGKCMVNADENRLREIIDNLVGNAIKYSPKEKKIIVRVARVAKQSESEGESVVVSVKDYGQGLSEEDKEKLFGKFQRLSAKPTGGESSTGLGLSIVKQLVELHGGRVWAESEGLGAGATFFAQFPAVA
jgi:signal transduction histidine kinase